MTENEIVKDSRQRVIGRVVKSTRTFVNGRGFRHDAVIIEWQSTDGLHRIASAPEDLEIVS